MAFITVVSVSPADGSTGLSLAPVVEVEFDVPIDPDSILGGRFILTQEAKEVVEFGPSYAMMSSDPVSASGSLYSNQFRGIIDSVIALSDSTYKKVRLTPSSPLEPNTEYIVLLSPNVLTRTTFDVVPGSGNTGTGSITQVKGPYTGSRASDSIVVEVLTTGGLGVAQYKWYFASLPGVFKQGTLDREILLSHKDIELTGIMASFGAGNYAAGDTFSIPVKKGESFGSVYSWHFTTGSGSVLTPPSVMPSSKIIGKNISGPVSLFGNKSGLHGAFYVVRSDPTDGEIRVSLPLNQIKVVFSAPLDAASISDATVAVEKQLADRYLVFGTKTTVAKTLSVSGQELTITLT